MALHFLRKDTGIEMKGKSGKLIKSICAFASPPQESKVSKVKFV